MRCYSHLSDDEREQIGLAKALGHSIGAIAQAIGRPKSTVSRELSRNKLPSGPVDAPLAWATAPARPQAMASWPRNSVSKIAGPLSRCCGNVVNDFSLLMNAN